MSTSIYQDSMKRILGDWISRYFADEEAVVLVLLLVAGIIIFATIGQFLTPFIAALIFAFMLQGAVVRLKQLGLPDIGAVGIAFSLFVGFMVGCFFVLMPLVARQATNLLNQVPGIVSRLQSVILDLPEKYPQLMSEAVIKEISTRLSQESANLAEGALTFLIGALPGAVALLVYLFLVPFLVFFMLRDKDSLLATVGAFFPEDRPVMKRIWAEMNVQSANYIRGKFVEIVVVGGVSYIAFLFLGLDYAALLALLVGLSVIIPYIGATVVTLPVLLVGFFQWGWGSEFIWLMVVYGVIQVLDGNVLVPLLFSEAVNLHPVTIILAVLVFGGIWGFWGVFFAIPLATLVKAMLNAWPRVDDPPPPQGEPVSDQQLTNLPQSE
ncbi:MAG: AI-2E family transporter [bacterium]